VVKKLKIKIDMLRSVGINSPKSLGSQFRRIRKRRGLRWEGFAKKKDFKPRVKE